MKTISRVLSSLSILSMGLALLASGCARQPGPKSPEIPTLAVSELSPDQQQKFDRAESAKTKLADELMRELAQAMSQPPLTGAIKVCKEEAPLIAARVAEETGLAIGRTSFKLRNIANQPPEWAGALVEGRVEQPTCVELDDEKLGVLFPIRLQNTCTLCHGTEVSSEVKAAIVSNYPQDRATGFAEGDLRGYFWVEVGEEGDEE